MCGKPRDGPLSRGTEFCHSQNTDIPIPKVYAYDLHDQNGVGGATLHRSRREPILADHEGIPAPFVEKFWRQVAKVMIQLASIRLPKIGSIIRNEEDPGSFTVGPLVITGSGPYDSTSEFYADYSVALSKSLSEMGWQVDGQEELIQAFQSLATSFYPTARARDSSAADFGPAKYDLGPNNILVDPEFNVLAIIDWESVATVPDAALYRLRF